MREVAEAEDLLTHQEVQAAVLQEQLPLTHYQLYLTPVVEGEELVSVVFAVVLVVLA
jgi:hypothetical protein